MTASREWLDGIPLPETSPPTHDGGVLVVRVMNEPATLNYLDDASHDVWVHRMTGRLVLESLVELSPIDFSVQPGLASRWSDGADHLTTRFTLSADRSFSNGVKLTAEDVVASLKVVLDPKRPTGSTRGELSTLLDARVVDPVTVELKWSSPTPFAIRALSRVPIFSKQQLDGDWSELGQRPLGTGPYVIESWERGKALTLVRRPGATTPLERIVFRFVKDHTAAAALFEKGEVDVMTNIQPTLWRALEKDEPSNDWAKRDWQRIRSLENSYSYVAWNERVAPLGDVRVRRALAQLYDATLITRIVDLDLEVPTTCPYFREGASCSPEVKRLPFSVDDARAQLLDAGFVDADGDGVLERDGKPLRLRFLLPATSVRLGKLVPMLQEQWRAAGAELEVEKVETTTLSARVARRDFEIVSRVWTEFDREQEVFPMFHSSQIDGGSNFVGYASPEADRLMEAIRSELDADRRHALERELHARLYADQPYLFMTARQSLDAAKRRVHGMQPSVLWYDLRRVWVSD